MRLRAPASRSVSASVQGLTLACLLSLAACAHQGAGPTVATSSPLTHSSNSASAASTIHAPAAALPGPWDGRLSLKLLAFGQDAARGVNMAFYLSGTPERGQLDLSTPMGTQMASVRWQQGEAVLVTADGSQGFTSLDELTQHLLGEALPVTALMSWLQGRPDPLQPFAPAPDAGAQVSVFDQAGWRVDLSQRQAGHLEASRAATAYQRGAALKVRLDP